MTHPCWYVEWLDLTSLMWAVHLPPRARLFNWGHRGSAPGINRLEASFCPLAVSLSVFSNHNAVTSDLAVPGIDQTFLPIKGSLPTRRSFVPRGRRAGEPEGRKKSTRPLLTLRYKNRIKNATMLRF